MEQKKITFHLNFLYFWKSFLWQPANMLCYSSLLSFSLCVFLYIPKKKCWTNFFICCCIFNNKNSQSIPKCYISKKKKEETYSCSNIFSYSIHICVREVPFNVKCKKKGYYLFTCFPSLHWQTSWVVFKFFLFLLQIQIIIIIVIRRGWIFLMNIIHR